MNILYYFNGSSENHGCEAIVRASAIILNEDILLYSARPEEDYRYNLQEVIGSIEYDSEKNIGKYSLQWFASRIETKMTGAIEKTIYYKKQTMFDNVEQGDIAFSIGGDNYCYGVPHFIHIINQQLRKQGVKTILWGCSVEPDAMKGEMLEDLKGYTHIFARESITYQAMKEIGITQVSLYPDPAFQLNRIDLPLPNGFVEKNTIGINVSPMIIGHEKNQGITLKNYITLIQHLIDHTDMQIALIPHVVWNHNDDRKPLTEIYHHFKENTAEELKGFIARCRFMIAARTHASIAAYSEQVPTLVVGYSVKARGIARDIFGDEKHYVIPVQ